MRLDYGTQISPTPITLSIGTLRKPTLKEISQLTFDKFRYYEFFIKLTPEIFFTKLQEDDGKNYRNSFLLRLSFSKRATLFCSTKELRLPII